jgi:hypothetical protein
VQAGHAVSAADFLDDSSDHACSAGLGGFYFGDDGVKHALEAVEFDVVVSVRVRVVMRVVRVVRVVVLWLGWLEIERFPATDEADHPHFSVGVREATRSVPPCRLAAHPRRFGARRVFWAFARDATALPILVDEDHGPIPPPHALFYGRRPPHRMPAVMSATTFL